MTGLLVARWVGGRGTMLAPGMLGLHLPAPLLPRGGILGARNGCCHSQGELTPQVSGEGRILVKPCSKCQGIIYWQSRNLGPEKCSSGRVRAVASETYPTPPDLYRKGICWLTNWLANNFQRFRRLNTGLIDLETQPHHQALAPAFCRCEVTWLPAVPRAVCT